MSAPRRGPDAAQLAAEYKAGATLNQLAARHGINEKTVRRRLKEAGATMRPNRAVPLAPNPAVSPVIRQLAAVMQDANQSRILRLAGVSPTWWGDARSGAHSPLLPLLEAVANAAGYEIVLRRRLTAVRMEDAA